MKPQTLSRTKRSIREKAALPAAARAAAPATDGELAEPHDIAYAEHPLHVQIEVTAYYRAQQRGFEPGHELEDWLAAEAEVLAKLQASALNPALPEITVSYLEKLS